jgi:nitrite reductase/ring-hydroxylating ferredoxin subunit
MSEVIELQLAGTYRRRVKASLARIWENVFDWEHLAHLHDGSFAECALIERSTWGWRVDLTPVAGTTQRIEMRANRAGGSYLTRTLEGSSKGAEIRVALVPVDTDIVDVTVEFHLPETRPARLAALGEAYATTYARLWDEDETMMQAREHALARRTPTDRSVRPLELGDERAVRAALPLAFELGGTRFRLIDVDGVLLGHATVCPHWLGPLDAAPVVDGELRCPWHGYRFDVITGRCRSHAVLRLAAPPEIQVVDGRVIARWRAQARWPAQE